MDVRNPIRSYGMIVFYNDESQSQRRFLLFKRRDTYEYMGFIRGFWKSSVDIFQLFNNMTYSERIRIRDYTFNELWDDLWIDQKSKYRKSISYAQEKFNSISKYIPFILESTTTKLLYPPWGFPKGRREREETKLECAVREFVEETGIYKPLTISVLMRGVPSLKERYRGTDGKNYEVEYFIGKVDEKIYPCLIPTDGIRKTSVSEESECIEWFTIDQARSILCERLFSLLLRADKITNL